MKNFNELQNINLDNVSQINSDKSKNVLNYIKMLPPTRGWTNQQKVLFDKIKREALEKTTANEMLDAIGYHFKGFDGIYQKVNRL